MVSMTMGKVFKRDNDNDSGDVSGHDDIDGDSGDVCGDGDDV